MRTRHGSYPSATDGIAYHIRPSAASQSNKRPRCGSGGGGGVGRGGGGRRSKALRAEHPRSPFDELHDDLVTTIITAVSSTASSPADLVNTMLTCRRFCAIVTRPQVLAAASIAAMDVRVSAWSDGAHRFLKQCADAGNAEACYTLGMITFYCLNNRAKGSSLMAKAAVLSHAPALHSLAVIQFNGSGGSRKDKDLKAGVALCWRAAVLGHVDAMREMGHCLQDGYGIVKNVSEGRRLLLEANTLEAAAAVAQSPRSFVEAALRITSCATAEGRGGGGGGGGVSAMGCLHHHLHYYSVIGKAKAAAAVAAGAAPPATAAAGAAAAAAAATVPAADRSCGVESNGATNTNNTASSNTNHPVYRLLQGRGCSLLSDYGCNVPPPKLHVANRFLVDWFTKWRPAEGLRLCSHDNCGRPETRKHEFRRCSACGSVNYCSRACQALDWKIRHKADCRPVDWEEQNDEEDEQDEEQQQQQQHDQHQQDDEMET